MGLFGNGPLIIASHNHGKIREIAALLAPFSVDVSSSAALGLEEPEETGLTFIANAEIKSRAASLASGNVALADDSGLSVAALDGAPGIYSARWAGPEKDFGHAMALVKSELEKKHVDPQGSKASFICALSLCYPDGKTVNFEGEITGHLSFPPRGERGFGYDPIFIPEGYDRSFAEIDEAEKNLISHRARAFAQFVAYIRQIAA